jgi:hypothetical protein
VDSSGAVIPAAIVGLTQVGTGLSRTVESNTQGDYLIPSLQPADYILTVQAKGFQKFTQADITLLANQSATVKAVPKRHPEEAMGRITSRNNGERRCRRQAALRR